MSMAIFGKLQTASPTEVFTVNQSSGADSNQLLAQSMKREIDRLQGYKTNLTPAQTNKLARLQGDIERLEARAGPDGLSLDQRDDRAEMYREANEILGKPYVDVDADPELAGMIEQVDRLLEPRHQGAKKKRLENLRGLEEKLYDSYFAGNTSNALARQLANVKNQIARLTQPRPMNELSPGERRDYDALVDKVNARAGSEYLMPSGKRARAEALQKQMQSL